MFEVLYMQWVSSFIRYTKVYNQAVLHVSEKAFVGH